MRTYFIAAAIIVCSTSATSQEGNWEVYLAQYEKGPGSTVVNMDLRKAAPIKNKPFLFSAGVKFTNCRPDGFPVSGEFEILNKISDSVTATVSRLVSNIIAGTFTYQCERRDYFYVSDTSGLRSEITNLINRRFPGYEPAFNIKPDIEWEAYLTFLYPSETIMQYIKNEKILDHLRKAGDQLDKPRQVDHWLYFKTEGDRDCFIRFATLRKFKIETKEKIDNQSLPFKLQLSRTDLVDITSISKITLEMEQEARKCNGDYDGWETFVIK